MWGRILPHNRNTMPLLEKLTVEDLALYEIMRNPVLCAEFVENFDKLSYEEPFEVTWYQKEILCDFNNYVSIIAGRSAGKTVALVLLISWILTFNVFPSDYIVYLVPNKVHLEPVWSGLIRKYRTNSFLKHFISPNAGINSSDFKITLLNQAVLMARIAGQSGTGVSVIGLHTPFFMVDESGYQPWGSWLELQPTINTFTTGFRLMVSGVPDGRRENSVCYHADQENSSYSKHRIPSDLNPRLTEEDRQRAVEQYGGEDSDDFTHLWKAQHGKPVFALFDRNQFDMSNDPVYRLVLNGIALQDNLSEYISRLSLFPGLPNKNNGVIFGIDLGYTEPSAIVILYLDSHDRIHFHGRIRLDKVSYPIQKNLIDKLDDKFNPIIIGVDASGVGKPIVQDLLENNDYAHKDYNKRMFPIDFSSYIAIGIDSDGTEIKSKAKPLATSILQDYSNNHKIVYSHTDLEFISELERMTYTKNPSGDIVYRTLTQKGGKRGEDHFTSALLVAAMAYYLKNDFTSYRPQRKSLARPGWM
jgi:hypothetical protein